MPHLPRTHHSRSLPGDAWIRRHESAVLLTLVAVAVLLRVLLAVRSPTPYGYVFDFYHEAIQKAYTLGRLPSAADCWQCYHPPLLTILGLPLYALGKALVGGPAGLADPALRFVAPLSLIGGAVTAWFSYTLLRFYRFRGAELAIGMALVLVFPCLFISSYGIEADIVMTALMTAFLYYQTRFFNRPRSAGAARAALLGALAGLACATKYTGLLAPLTLASIAALSIVTRPGRGPVLGDVARRTALALAICLALGSWKYVDNLQRHGTLLFANGSAVQGFALTDRPSYWRSYDFLSLRLSDLLRLAYGEVRPAHLTDLPFYRSVWTTLHGMAWGDMSVFSDPSRHGFYRELYPRKAISPPLASMVLVLGLVPGVLAIAGLLATFRRRLLWPLALLSAGTLVFYVAWFVAQESWSLKTKYVLFLLPAYVVYALLGLRAVRRVSPLAANLLLAAVMLLIASAQLYLLDFVMS